jgi:hypothetical protein
LIFPLAPHGLGRLLALHAPRDARQLVRRQCLRTCVEQVAAQGGARQDDDFLSVESDVTPDIAGNDDTLCINLHALANRTGDGDVFARDQKRTRDIGGLRDPDGAAGKQRLASDLAPNVDGSTGGPQVLSDIGVDRNFGGGDGGIDADGPVDTDATAGREEIRLAAIDCSARKTTVTAMRRTLFIVRSWWSSPAFPASPSSRSVRAHQLIQMRQFKCDIQCGVQRSNQCSFQCSFQCAINTGTVIDCSTVRVTPPSNTSRKRE